MLRKSASNAWLQNEINRDRNSPSCIPLFFITRSQTLVSFDDLRMAERPSEIRSWEAKLDEEEKRSYHRKKQLVHTDSSLFKDIEKVAPNKVKGRAMAIRFIENNITTEVAYKYWNGNLKKSPLGPGFIKRFNMKPLCQTMDVLFQKVMHRFGERVTRVFEEQEIWNMLILKHYYINEAVVTGMTNAKSEPLITCPSLEILNDTWMYSRFDAYECHGGNFKGIPDSPNEVSKIVTNEKKYMYVMANNMGCCFKNVALYLINVLEETKKAMLPREVRYFKEWNEIYANIISNDPQKLAFSDNLESTILEDQLKFYDEYLTDFCSDLNQELSYENSVRDEKFYEFVDKIVNAAVCSIKKKYPLELPTSGYIPSIQFQHLAKKICSVLYGVVACQEALRFGCFTSLVENNAKVHRSKIMLHKEYPMIPSMLLKNLIQAENGGKSTNYGDEENGDISKGKSYSAWGEGLIKPMKHQLRTVNDISNSPYYKKKLMDRSYETLQFFQAYVNSKSRSNSMSLDRKMIKPDPVKKDRDRESKRESHEFQVKKRKNQLNKLCQTAAWIHSKDCISSTGIMESAKRERVYMMALYTSADTIFPYHNNEIRKELVIMALIRANMVLQERNDPRRLISSEMGHRMRYSPQEMLTAAKSIVYRLYEQTTRSKSNVETYSSNRVSRLTVMKKTWDLEHPSIRSEALENTDRWYIKDPTVLESVSGATALAALSESLLSAESQLLISWRMLVYYQTRDDIMTLAMNMCEYCMNVPMTRVEAEKELDSDVICLLFNH